jgi:hypothetical protein
VLNLGLGLVLVMVRVRVRVRVRDRDTVCAVFLAFPILYLVIPGIKVTFSNLGPVLFNRDNTTMVRKPRCYQEINDAKACAKAKAKAYSKANTETKAEAYVKAKAKAYVKAHAKAKVEAKTKAYTKAKAYAKAKANFILSLTRALTLTFNHVYFFILFREDEGMHIVMEI